MENNPSQNQLATEIENFLSDHQSDMDCLLAAENAEFRLQLEGEEQKLKTEQGDQTSKKPFDIRTEIEQYFESSEDDDLCFKAAEEAEKNISYPDAGTSVSPSLSSSLHTIKNTFESEKKTKLVHRRNESAQQSLSIKSKS